jgi:hypothetical protein
VDVLLWIALLLLLGAGGFLVGLLSGMLLIPRAVRGWVLPSIGVVAFLAYNVFPVVVWPDSDASGLIVTSPLQLLGWFLGTAVARRAVRKRRAAKDGPVSSNPPS